MQRYSHQLWIYPVFGTSLKVWIIILISSRAYGRPTVPKTVDELLSTGSSPPLNWLHNPCGVAPEYLDSLITADDDEVLQVDYAPFLLQLMVTLARIQHWINDFVYEKFRMSFSEKEIEDEGMHYPWLLVASSVPKINERNSIIAGDRVDKDKLVKYFVVIQQIMQRFAIVWHKEVIEEEEDTFHAHFHETKVLNKLILCELNLLLTAKKVQQSIFRNPVRLPPVLRDLKYESDRSMRNYRIIKDYVRALHYFIHFTHFVLGELVKV